MNRLTLEQRSQIVQIYFENNGSVPSTYRALRSFYVQQRRTERAITFLKTMLARTFQSMVTAIEP